MTDSTFNSALDTLVQGEQPVTPDDLTRFTADLYRKEHQLTMPHALKQQVATDLGLDNSALRRAPVSRRPVRVARKEKAYARRPLPMVMTVVMATLVAITGIFQWGMEPNNDDNRFGILSPAVPTVEATPGATPPVAAWMEPVSAEECPRDQLQEVSARTNPSATWYSQEDYDAVSEVVVYGPFKEANEADADAVVTRMRQITACELALIPNHTLPTTSPRFEFELRTSEGRIAIARREGQRIQVAKDLSLFYQQELGLTPASLMIHQPNAELAERSFLPDGLNNFYNPAHAVEMGDGRVVVMMTMVGYGEEFPFDIAAAPTYGPPVFIFTEIDGQWYLDERLQLCIGECDAFWAERDADTPQATPAATPSGNIGWLNPITPGECPDHVVVTTGIPKVGDDRFSELPARAYGPYTLPAASTRDEVLQQAREIRACGQVGRLDPSMSLRMIHEMHDRDFVMSDEAEQLWANQIVEGQAISEFYAREYNVSSANLDLVMTADTAGLDDVSPGHYPVINPDWIVQLADGRVVVLVTALTVAPAGTPVAESSEPTAGFGAWAFVQQDGEWLLDEFLPVCFGECDRFWELRPGANLLRTSTMAACQYAETFIPDYEVRADAPINLRPGPGVQSGDAIAAMPGGSPVMFLCQSTLSTNPEIDDLYEDQVWMKMRTESGEVGWVREVDVEPRAWGTPVPTPTIAATTEIEPLSVSTSVPIDDDVQVNPTPSSTMPPEIEPIDVRPKPAG